MFKCNYCGKEFNSQNALNAHSNKCNWNKKFHYIYKITNKLNNRFYIGMHSTNDMDDGYMGSGNRLYREKEKYGLENFVKEILEYLPTREALALREKEIVNEDMLKEELCINLHIGGSGGFTKEESHKGWETSHKNIMAKLENDIEYRNNYCLTRRHILLNTWQNEEFRQYMLLNAPFCNGQAWQGRKHAEESKLKMHETHLKNKHQQGINNNNYGTCWIMKDNVSKKIKKEELESYIEEGWIKGRKCNSSEGLKKRFKNKENHPTYNKISINKDGKYIFINKDKLNEYLLDGWTKGVK